MAKKKLKYDEKDLERFLSRGLVQETRYMAVGTGHGYTTDKEQALAWAKNRAKNSLDPAYVVSCEATVTPWVLADTIEPPSSQEAS